MVTFGEVSHSFRILRILINRATGKASSNESFESSAARNSKKQRIMEERTLEKTCKKAQEEKNAEVSKIKKALAEAAAKKKALEQIDDNILRLEALLEHQQNKYLPTDLSSPAPHPADGSCVGPYPEDQWPSNKRKRDVTTPSPQKKKKLCAPSSLSLRRLSKG